MIGPVRPAKVYIDLMKLPEAPRATNGRAREVERGDSGRSIASPDVTAAERAKAASINRHAQVGAPAAGLAGVTPPEFSTAAPNFAGIGYTRSVPPDPNGAVGPNYYIQTVNSQFAVWNKQGTQVKAPVNINQLWSSQPTSECFLNNQGDPIVLYDALADRWLISQFADWNQNPSHECVAISPTGDPTAAGTWYLYDFAFNFSFDDYPKLSVWPDGYYFSSQRGYFGGNIDVAVFDRANMLNGNPATVQTFDAGTLTVILLPAELTGPAPAAGTPAIFARPIDGSIFGGSDRVEIWEFHVDWGNPSQSTFTHTVDLATDPFISGLCDPGDLMDNCIPQPDSSTPGVSTPSPKLESMNVWPMGPLQYRNFGSYETLVFGHTVNATGVINNSGGTTRAGMHWYELRRSGGSWSIYQESTFAPATDDGPVDRWMGSVAMDQAGNMALGYSVSNGTNIYPSIRYVGRQAGDPLDLMTTTETTLATGTDAQVLNGTRWGDYSSMRVDPVDGCTFWYTTQYSTGGVVDGSGNPGGAAWATRIGAFRFPTCNEADLSITKVGSPNPVTAGNILEYTITVKNNGPANAIDVAVSDSLPPGVSFLSSSISCTGLATKTCFIGPLNAGATATFTMQVRVASDVLANSNMATITITNIATVSADQLDPNTADNTATALTTIVESADVSVSKICKPDTTAVAGTNAFCDIFVANAGPSAAQHVTLSDALTSNGTFTIVSAAVTSGTGTCGTTNPVTCNLGTLGAGATDTIRVTVTSSATTDVNDRASVSSTTPDPDTTNNTATGKISFAASADLSVTKTATPATVNAGTNLTYTLTVHNAGPSTASNVVVKDTIPGEVGVLSVTPSVGSCTAGIPGNPLQPLICTMDSLASGASATISVVTKVSPSVPDNTVINNNASISSAVADANNANDSATAAALVIARADLSIAKNSDANTYKPSSTIAYTVTVSNVGPSDAQAVIVTDSLPALQQAIYQSNTGGCTLAGLVLTCNLGTMPVGTTKSFNIYERINGNQRQVSNTASVTSSTVDPSVGNNTSTRTVKVGK